MQKSILALILLLLAFLVLVILHVGGQFFLERSAKRQIHDRGLTPHNDSRAQALPENPRGTAVTN
jgi:uncharacterized protein YneF (UPF0154 family)